MSWNPTSKMKTTGRFKYAKILLLLIVFTLFLTKKHVSASIGDRLIVYMKCLEEYKLTPELIAEDNRIARSSYLIRLLKRNPREFHVDKCINHISNIYRIHSLPPIKFYGRWVFKRYLGIEEPASFIISLINLSLSILFFKKICSTKVRDNHGYKYLISGVYFSAAVAWLFSSLYHFSGRHLLEILDYFGASFLTISLLLFAVARTYKFYEPSAENKKLSNIKLIIASVVVFGLLIPHAIILLGRYPLDYDYNIRFSIISASLVYILDLTYLIKSFKTDSTAKKYLLIDTLLISFYPLEFFDFSPVFDIFDAHSLWHLSSTVLSIFFFHITKEDLFNISGFIENKIK